MAASLGPRAGRAANFSRTAHRAVLSLDDVPFPGPAEWVDGLVEGRRGALVQWKAERSVWRVAEDGRVWFAKRGGRGKVREIAREAQWLERLAAAGVPVDRASRMQG